MTGVDWGPAFEAIDAYVTERMGADGTPGVGLALTDRDRTIRVAAYGSADLMAGKPVKAESLFEIGSIGKSFTADALLILAERGAVDLDAPVTRYLPWFAVRSRFEPILLRHLLTHTGGIVAGPDGSPSGDGEVWQLRETEASSPPGARFHYSNVGYKALGLVAAAVAGRPYPEAIRELVLAPLGMDATEPAITNAIRPRLAVGYTGLHDDRPFHPRHPLVPATWLETDTGDGCLACPPGDLAAYARMLLNRGRGPADSVMSEASFARKTAPHAAAGEGVAYGFGISVYEQGDRTLIGHGGGMVGYLAYLLTDPAAGFGVAVLINGPGYPSSIARFALDTLSAVAAGEALPPPRSAPAGEAAKLAGVFGRVEGDGPEDLRIEASGDPQDPVGVRFGGASLPAEWDWADSLVVEHPAHGRFRLAVERDEDGAAVALAHGGAWYLREGTVAPVVTATPPEWSGFPGHYRSHNPWCPSFDVVLRRGRLQLLFPEAPDGFDDDQPLTPRGEPGLYRAGDDPAGPEFVAFGSIAAGRALRATLSGCDYWRVGDP